MRRYVIFISAGLSLLMYSIDGSAVAVAFPRFMNEFGTNVLWAGWTISIYLVAITSVMPLAGKLSDSLGSKKVFLVSLILFTGSSLLAALHPTSTPSSHLGSYKGLGVQALSQQRQPS